MRRREWCRRHAPRFAGRNPPPHIVEQWRREGETSTRAAFLGADGRTPADVVENVFDRLAWVTRYSNGGVSMEAALRMDGWLLRRYIEALDRLLAREQNKADPTPRDDEEPDW